MVIPVVIRSAFPDPRQIRQVVAAPRRAESGDRRMAREIVDGQRRRIDISGDSENTHDITVVGVIERRTGRYDALMASTIAATMVERALTAS